jgi:hypothetical protein
MGLTFLMETAYLLPVTVFFLAVSVGALAFRANRRRGYGPFVVGVVAGVILLVGKFVVDSTVAVYGSIGLLIGAAIWNAWPVKASSGVTGTPTGTLHQIGRTGDVHNDDQT